MHPLEKYIINVPNFPKPGVVFKDITPLFRDHLPELIKSMSQDIRWDHIDYVVGIESRGFILGSALALQNKKGFIPIRKKGKLPPPVFSESYALEYGMDTLEMAHLENVQSKAKRVLIVDDVLATGGTLQAAQNLCHSNKLIVEEMLVFINLTFLNNYIQSGKQIKSVLSY